MISPWIMTSGLSEELPIGCRTGKHSLSAYPFSLPRQLDRRRDCTLQPGLFSFSSVLGSLGCCSRRFLLDLLRVSGVEMGLWIRMNNDECFGDLWASFFFDQVNNRTYIQFPGGLFLVHCEFNILKVQCSIQLAVFLCPTRKHLCPRPLMRMSLPFTWSSVSVEACRFLSRP